MGFGDNTRPKNSADGSSATGKAASNYMSLKGEVTIRLIDRTEDVFSYWRYFMPVNVQGTQQNRSIVVGRTGPIQQFMASIGEDDRRYRKPSKRLLVNVLDRADGRIKILDFGPDLLNKFTALHQRVRRRSDMTPMNIWDFDLQIISQEGKEPKDVTRIVLPGEDQDELAPDILALPKFDLALAVRVMPDDAQRRILNNEDLLDVLRDLEWEKLTPTVPQDLF